MQISKWTFITKGLGIAMNLYTQINSALRNGESITIKDAMDMVQMVLTELGISNQVAVTTSDTVTDITEKISHSVKTLSEELNKAIEDKELTVGEISTIISNTITTSEIDDVAIYKSKRKNMQ